MRAHQYTLKPISQGSPLVSVQRVGARGASRKRCSPIHGSQAEVVTAAPPGPVTTQVPITHRVDLTPLFQEYEPKPRGPLPSFDPLFRVLTGQEARDDDPKREVIRNFIGLGETKPRVVSPLLPRPADAPAPETLPLLYYLPGIDGTGLAAYRQFPLLVKSFDLRALVVPPDSRSTFQEIVDTVQEHIRFEAARSSNTRPIYLLGESFGGLLCLALAHACKDAVDRVVMVNPASSFDRTPWASMGGLLTLLPNEIYRLLPFALAPVLTNPFSLAMHDVDSRGNPLEQASDFAFGLVGLLPELSHLKLALPADTLSWRLQLLSQGCQATAPLVRKVPQRVLILAGQLDLLIPSQEEAQRLQRMLPRASVKVLSGRTHALLQEAGVDLLAIMEDEGFYRRVRRLSSDPVAPFPPASSTNTPNGNGSWPTGNGSSTLHSTGSNGRQANGVPSQNESNGASAVGTSQTAPASAQTPAASSSMSKEDADVIITSTDALTRASAASVSGSANGASAPIAPALSVPGQELDSVFSSGEESDGESSSGSVNTVTSVTIASRSGITSLNADLIDVLPEADSSKGALGTSWKSTAASNGSSTATPPSKGQKKKLKRKSSSNFGAAGPVEMPTEKEVQLVFERTGIQVLKNLVSPVYFSTSDDGRVEQGLGAVPTQRPLLFVGNHQLLDPSLPFLIEQFLKEKGILLRGLAHPIISQQRQEPSPVDLGPMNVALRTMAERSQGNGTGTPSMVNFMTTFGAVPVGPKNFYSLLQQGEAVLLYPGGVREVYKRKAERYKLIWPERSEFVRMAARLGATIVPFSGVGAEDSVVQLLDSKEVSELPVVGPWLVEQARRLPSARKGVNVDSEVLDLFIQPVIAPAVPARYYFKFGKPIYTSPEMADDKEKCEELYAETRQQVESGLGWLLRKRESDPYKELAPRLLYESSNPGEQAPTFKLDA